MNGVELSALLSNVDDKYILELLNSEKHVTISKNTIMRIGKYSISIAAMLVLILFSSWMLYPLINGTSDPTILNDTTPTMTLQDTDPRPAVDWEQQMWDEMDMNEKYTKLVMDDMVYLASDGNCGKIKDNYIGTFFLVGYEKKYENNNEVSETEQDKTEKIETENSLLVGYIILGDKEIEEETVEHTTKVNVYEISGISKRFAVGVEFEETEECFAYYNSAYSADSFHKFAEDSSLENYLSISKVYRYQENATYCSDDDISTDIVLSVLFSDKTVPMLSSSDLVEAYQAGIMRDSYKGVEDSGNSTKPYNPEAENVRQELMFFVDKEYGEEVAGFSVNYDLLGQENVSISLRSGGFVTTNIGNIGKCFYVGKDAIEEVCNWLDSNVSFSEISK